MRTSRRTPHGVSLIELLATLSVAGFLAALAVPALSTVAREMTLRAAANEVAAVFSQARFLALQHRREVGVKWVAAGGDILFSIHEDGNQNGVMTADIRSGVDRLVFGPLSIKTRYPRVTFSFLPGPLRVDPAGNPLGDLSDPIRFGQSDICSFSPTGHASPGSVYLSEGLSRQALVRVSPGTGKIQVYEWSAPRRSWAVLP